MKCLISVHCVTRASPVVKDFIFFFPLTSFFTCRNHCNICTGYEFFCHKKGHKYPWGDEKSLKRSENYGFSFFLSSQAGATFTDTCFQHMVKKNIHRYVWWPFLISSIMKEMTNFELSQKHILVPKFVLYYSSVKTRAKRLLWCSFF